MEPQKTYYLRMQSPIGELLLTGTAEALTGVYMEDHKGAPPLSADAASGHPLLSQAQQQLEEYFAGKRTCFTVPLSPQGTPFQRAVWEALLQIPCADTRSYGALAAALGRLSAARAVGAANGRNPISILIPCHRVVGSAGDLTGYAGGVPRKRWLLAHERALTERQPPAQRGGSLPSEVTAS